MLCRHLPPSTSQFTTELLAIRKPGTRASPAAKCLATPFFLRPFFEIFIFIQHHFQRNKSCRRPYHQALHMQMFSPRTCIEPGLSSPHRSPFSAASPAVWRLRCPGESAPSNIQPQSFDRRAVIRTIGTFGYECAGGGPTWRRCSGEVFGRMRCLSPQKQVSNRALGQMEIARLGLWDPTTSLSSASGLERSAIPADGSEKHDIWRWEPMDGRRHVVSPACSCDGADLVRSGSWGRSRRGGFLYKG